MIEAAWRTNIAAALVAAAAALSAAPLLGADDATEQKETAPAEPVAEPEKPRFDVRKLFAMNCSWCHDGYGLHAGKGPKLAGTKMNERQIYERISKGKSGMMPGFEKTLKKDQIDAFVEYIKALKDPDT
jgi:mono/diheme cytochrome c family protein